MEQPEALQATLDHRIVDGHIDLSFDGVPDDVLQNCERICVVACGTAMHAGYLPKRRSVKITNADGCRVASEFLYSNPVIDEKTLVYAISQSGETIDTLEALKYARKKVPRVLRLLMLRVPLSPERVIMSCIR